MNCVQCQLRGPAGAPRPPLPPGGAKELSPQGRNVPIHPNCSSPQTRRALGVVTFSLCPEHLLSWQQGPVPVSWWQEGKGGLPCGSVTRGIGRRADPALCRTWPSLAPTPPVPHPVISWTKKAPPLSKCSHPTIKRRGHLRPPHWRSCCNSVVTNLTSAHEDPSSIPDHSSGLRILCCSELRCRLQMRLGSCFTVAVA